MEIFYLHFLHRQVQSSISNIQAALETQHRRVGAHLLPLVLLDIYVMNS